MTRSEAPASQERLVNALSPHFIRSRIGKVCVAIIGSTPAEMIEKASSAVRENTFLEFRLDYLPNPLAALPKLKQFLSERSEVTAIATCRRAATGGKFKGTIAAELEVLEKAASSGFHLVDLELQTAEALKHGQLDKLRAHGAALIISYHDFATTKDLDGIFERIQPYEPEFIKIVSTAKTLADNVTMMRFLERTRDHGQRRRHLHGRSGNYQPHPRPARRQRLHLRRRARRAKRPAPGQICRPHARRDLPHRPARRRDQGLWRGRQSRSSTRSRR